MFNLELTIFTLIYHYNNTSLDVLSAFLSNTKEQVKKQGKMERNKFPSLKLKLYIFSSADD